MHSSSVQTVGSLPREVGMVGYISITQGHVFPMSHQIQVLLTLLFSTTTDCSHGLLASKSLESLRLTGKSMMASTELH